MRAPNLAGALVSAATALPQATLATVRDPAEQSTAIAALVPELAGHRYLSLTTFRKDGTPVATPVWFAAQGDRLVVASQAGAWKARRLARTPRALGAGCDVRGEVRGPQIELIGEVLPASEHAEAEAALTARYGLSAWGFRQLSRLAGRGARDYLALRPTPAVD